MYRYLDQYKRILCIARRKIRCNWSLAHAGIVKKMFAPKIAGVDACCVVGLNTHVIWMYKLGPIVVRMHVDGK